uniref:Xylose isomerase-like TIM barrel domain-containing protein n=1 Tax=Mola mola TaxID=94237 RepID=A0A3Q3VQT6_MOLML
NPRRIWKERRRERTLGREAMGRRGGTVGIRSTLELMLASKFLCGLLFVPSGGIWKAVEACTEIGGSSFALFLGSQRSWKRPAPDQTAAARFREERAVQGNCGSPKDDVFDRCSLLAEAINHAHQQTPAVVTVLENMSGQGSTVGGKFRVGWCLDTCHAFAGGVKATLDEFDQEVGLHCLRAISLNDSKGKVGCNLDRHGNIGNGHIGISAFRDIVNAPRLDHIPLILETPGRPGSEHAEQIELLYSLCEEKIEHTLTNELPL